jgi:putative molybdopterin biosynthesis protein
MSVYLHDIPLPEAKLRLKTALLDANLWQRLSTETIPLDERALGRILAGPVWAKVSSPHYHAAAMDGFAVHAGETGSAQPSAPLTLALGLQAKYVDTGDPLPEGFNAVIPVENTEALDAEGEITSDVRRPASIRIRASVTPWAHVRPLGEDIVATQLVLPAGHVLRPVDLGAVAAAGLTEVEVARKPRVAILPTGSELVPLGSKLQPGDILEYNSLMLAAQVVTWGGEATRFPITPDDFDQICEQVQQAAQGHDLILLNAGSSAGMEDFSAKVIEKLGRLLVHGVAVRPGHPVILGVIARNLRSHTETEATKQPQANLEQEIAFGISTPRNDIIPVIGVPGYPVSAALTGEIFIEPLLAKWLGRAPTEPEVVSAAITRKVASPGGDDDYLRVAVGRVGERLLAAPLSRGAGVLSSLVRADGLVILPRGVQGVEAGETVDVRLYRSPSEIARTIFCIGSHDLTLDLLAQFLAERERRFVSANVGSLGGLLALGKGEAHLAGSHLLDTETGEYNLSYIKKYLPGVPVKVMVLVRREQGLIIRQGNPKKIHALSDLARSGVTFVNRQRGAGTRVLLDYYLNREGISSEQVAGYTQEEYTHLSVAAAVASGRADCGLGIAAAAQALNLDFVPLFQERYDLIIPRVYAESELLAPLFDVVNDQAFREAVAVMPGYDVSLMGTLIE